MTAIQNRYEFVFLFDVKNGNPNGDPDSGNMPRIDPETQKGLVTDVCMKRKVRDYVELAKGGAAPFAIYMQSKVVLNNQNKRAYEALGLKEESKKLPKDVTQANAITRWMCDNFYDVRSFGAVMTTEVNSGQVRGPVQFAFAMSNDPVLAQEITITRSSVTNERDAEKEKTMGRKYIVPYGLYRMHGFISASLAGDATRGTGFSEADLELLFEALENMFDHDRSAARGEMNARKLIVFKHASVLGNAPAQKLFPLVSLELRQDITTPRDYSDYNIMIDKTHVPPGVELVERL